ncbi:MAG: hypothetical protein GX846_03470 [Deltaproteobacteria bacterium]|nr:hypothetical protein [Deltaproteobacteria bacterium]
MDIRDNGGRRTGTDRRSYSYTGHIPERRTGVDRRSFSDRRDSGNAAPLSEQEGFEHRKMWMH